MNPKFPAQLAEKLAANPALFEEMEASLLGDLVFDYHQGELDEESAAVVNTLIQTNLTVRAVHQRILDSGKYASSENGKAWLEGMFDRALAASSVSSDVSTTEINAGGRSEQDCGQQQEMPETVLRTPGARVAVELSHLALAAAEDTLPELRPINDLLSGFTGDATGDGCAPSQSSVLRLACVALESPRPQTVPHSIIAVWPTGQTPPLSVAYRAGRWRIDVTLPLPWPETHALLEAGSIRIVTL
jgi:hypothetical protein